MTLFDLLFLFLLLVLAFNFVSLLFRRRGQQGRLDQNEDSLRQTQNLSREEAIQAGMSLEQGEQYQDSMSLSVCFARFALQVAYSDGFLSQNEVSTILGFFRGANPGLVEHIREVLEQDVNHPTTIDWDYNLHEARRILAKPQWHEFSAMIFDGLLRISLADGILNTRDLEIIFRIMSQLGWTRQRMESWFHTRAGFGSAFQGDSAHHGYYQHAAQAGASEAQKRREAFDILGLEPDAGPEAVKKRYRELVREHHPDRYASMGEEMQKTATKRFQIIQEAYEYITRSL
jgi:DnaJ-domain-containing protein 1